jgi:hypothetical protein
VAGVKMPFRWTVSWLSGRSIVELSEVRPNAAIEAALFARPAPATRGSGGRQKASDCATILEGRKLSRVDIGEGAKSPFYS